MLCICFYIKANAQTGILLTENYNGEYFKNFVQRIENTSTVHFYYDSPQEDSLVVNINTANISLDSFLKSFTTINKLNYAVDLSGNIFISRQFSIKTTLPENLFGKPVQNEIVDKPAVPIKQQDNKGKVKLYAANRVYEIGKQSSKPISKTVLSGYIRDIKTGEALAGASLFVDSLVAGVSTDQYGYYSIVLPPGRHTLKISSTGMKETKRQLLIYSDGQLDVEMQEAIATLKAVVVTSEKVSNTRSLQMGANKLNIKSIKQVPVAFGETDIIKVVLTLPGVTSAGEAANGFNVRGGATDQNLILLNDAVIYNPSHLFGLFSAFNPDVVKGLELYKSAIPVKYGGRISSVLDISMLDVNLKKV